MILDDCSIIEPLINFFFLLILLHDPVLLKGTLPFLELGTTVGVQSISVSAQNGLSSVISIPEGFIFGNSTQTSVYVRNYYALVLTNN